MKYRICEHGEIRLVGETAVKRVAIEEGSPNDEGIDQITSFWSAPESQRTLGRVRALADGSVPDGLLGLSCWREDGSMSYLVAVATAEARREGMEEIIIPRATWAVFDGVFKADASDHGISELYQRIWTEWFPTSGYEPLEQAGFERYPERDERDPDYRFEIWVPVRAV